jgi:hypothetical protein
LNLVVSIDFLQIQVKSRISKLQKLAHPSDNDPVKTEHHFSEDLCFDGDDFLDISFPDEPSTRSTVVACVNNVSAVETKEDGVTSVSSLPPDFINPPVPSLTAHELVEVKTEAFDQKPMRSTRSRVKREAVKKEDVTREVVRSVSSSPPTPPRHARNKKCPPARKKEIADSKVTFLPVK